MLAGLAFGSSLLAGCTSGPATTTRGASAGPTTGATTAPTPSATPAAATAVTVVRSGGMAPATRALRVAPDGTWEYSGGRNPVQRGRMTAAQRERLTTLVGALAGESAPASGHACPDGYRYSVTAGAATADATDCDLPARPAVAALIAFVTATTPM